MKPNLITLEVPPLWTYTTALLILPHLRVPLLSPLAIQTPTIVFCFTSTSARQWHMRTPSMNCKRVAGGRSESDSSPGNCWTLKEVSTRCVEMVQDRTVSSVFLPISFAIHSIIPPSSSSIGTATLVGYGLLNYHWVFSAGRFLQSAVASGTSNPQLGGPVIRTF